MMESTQICEMRMVGAGQSRYIGARRMHGAAWGPSNNLGPNINNVANDD